VKERENRNQQGKMKKKETEVEDTNECE